MCGVIWYVYVYLWYVYVHVWYVVGECRADINAADNVCIMYVYVRNCKFLLWFESTNH